ncbi:MAG: acetamidase/formamidase family protein [Clostridia bacterium]|nr:acetamidase/formamidase family protein [Clostridia bacterium]MCL6521671.1 acetamidase/formamidase family protein [Bacillota bacterium]
MEIRTVHAAQHHFGWDRSLPPVLEVEPGETVDFEVVDASGGQLGPDSTADELARLDFGRLNPVTGPVFVRGARPGDALEVEILDFSAPAWGWTAILPGFGLLADEFPEPYLKIWELSGGRAEFRPGIELPIRPFPGTIGVALAEPGRHDVIPPRQNGGNMDIRHLTRGARLLLPVWVEGALFSVGDTHAAQGDGEVCGTAIETPLRITLRFGLRPGLGLSEPEYELPAAAAQPADPAGYHVTTGIAPDLMEAARRAVRNQIRWLEREHGLSRPEAYALSSVAVDLRISEVVDAPNWLVSAFLPLSIFR